MMLPLKLPIKIGLLLLAIFAAGILWHQTQLTVLALAQINPVPETQRLSGQRGFPLIVLWQLVLIGDKILKSLPLCQQTEISPLPSEDQD